MFVYLDGYFVIQRYVILKWFVSIQYT